MEKKEAEELAIRIAAETDRLRQKSSSTGNNEELDDDEGDEGAGHNEKYVPEIRYRNPEAKFVLTAPLEPRHLEYAERHVGEVLSFPAEIEEKLEMLGMFQPKYGFQFMRKPISLIRPNSGLVARRLVSSAVEDRGTEYRRVIVAGKGGTGKSFILLQIAAFALLKNYIVVAVPRGMDLVDNRTAYSPDPNSGRYKQLDYLAEMLFRTRQACGDQLREMYTTQAYETGRETIKEGTSLEDLLEIPEYHVEAAQDVFMLFLNELRRQEDRAQVLFLFDNISAISAPTQIPDPHNARKTLHPHSLWLPFFFLHVLSGGWTFPRAAIVAATSGYPAARSLDVALGVVQQHPYEELDPRVAISVKGAEVIMAGDRLTPEEAMGLSSYYKDAGLLKTVDRYDALSKSVGDEDYHFPRSGFWIYNPDGKEKEEDKIHRDPFDFKRRGRLNQSILKSYLRRGGTVPSDDATDYEATMERLALAGGTARGFWKACTRMSHY